MKFKLEINFGNAAMSNRGHLCNALRSVAREILEGRKWFSVSGTKHKIMDINGNSVGFWKMEE